MESGTPHLLYPHRSGEAERIEPKWKAPGSVVSVEDPVQSRFDRALPGVLWIVVWGYAAFTAVGALAAPVGKFDDAIPLLHGMLVQQGRTPNLDFYSFYPPLSLYLNAAAFSLMGRSIIAARLVADIFYVGVLS